MRRMLATLSMLALMAAASTTLAQPIVVDDPNDIRIPKDPLRPLVPPATRPPTLDGNPVVQNYIAPGVEGIFSILKRDEGAIVKPPKGGKLLRPYTRYRSLSTPADSKHFAIGQIVVKFAEGSGVSLRGDTLRTTGADSAQLSRFGIRPSTVQEDLLRFSRLVVDQKGTVSRALPSIDSSDLLRLRQRGQLLTKRELPNLDLFFHVYLREPDPGQALALLQSIQELPSVESAYFQPLPFGAIDKAPLTTIDVTPSQGYFGPAPLGIDANFGHLFSGGRGNVVRIADIEGGWDDSHEDLPAMSFRLGVNWAVNEENGSHGAAVLGELVAQENGFGANGLVPNAMVGWSSVTNFDPKNIFFYSVANALIVAGKAIQAGDVALIEQQFANPNAVAFVCDKTVPGSCPCTSDAWVAVEEYPAEHAAISAMTAAGIVVVEAAGNGAVQVNPASTADSGAIVVGASMQDGDPFCWSNYGPRVDVRAWGSGIGSLGYGGFLGTSGIVAVPALRMNGPDNEQWYTRSFGGTSGASPIVVGAAAIIQSTRAVLGQPKLNSIEMRSLLVSTGTPQKLPVVRKIGPQPNLRAAVATYIPDAATFISQTSAPTIAVQPHSTFNVTQTFKNTGGLVWSGDHTISVAPSSQNGVQQFQSSPEILGSSTTPISPGDMVVRNFAVTAPDLPGTYSLSFLLKNSGNQTLAASPSQTVAVIDANGFAENASISIDSFPSSLAKNVFGVVTGTFTNTGTATWSPSFYTGRLSRSGRVSLPRPTIVLSRAIGAGSSQSFFFAITCNGLGTGTFSVTMVGKSGPFGPSVGRTVVCN